MTKREACEQIVAHGDCVGVGCDNMDKVRLAKLWLRLHPCEKKLVFSAEKFYADKSSLECLKALSRESGWPEDCNGKTEEECYLLGFEVHKNWMEER